VAQAGKRAASSDMRDQGQKVQKMVDDGLEPPTVALLVRYSTD
jgi:hypothetical protein